MKRAALPLLALEMSEEHYRRYKLNVALAAK
jgi:hypothetical protein